MPRFFTGKPENGFITLKDGDAHHALRVLRLKPGASVTLCNGAGTDYECRVERTGKNELVCRVCDERLSEGEPNQCITVFMALPKGDKMDIIVQKTVELGVSDIVPFVSANCVSRPSDPIRKSERWRRIALEAAGQCGRGSIPRVHDIVNVAEAFGQAAENETALFCYEGERRTGLRDVLSKGMGSTVAVVIGPEGGFSQEEARAAKSAGLISVSLGRRVLRCETAPIAVLAVILYAGGNMDSAGG